MLSQHIFKLTDGHFRKTARNDSACEIFWYLISTVSSGGTPQSWRLTVRRKGGGCVINARRLPLRLAEPAPPQSLEIPASARNHRARSRVRRGHRRRVGKRDKAWRGTARRAARSCGLFAVARRRWRRGRRLRRGRGRRGSV